MSEKKSRTLFPRQAEVDYELNLTPKLQQEAAKATKEIRELVGSKEYDKERKRKEQNLKKNYPELYKKIKGKPVEYAVGGPVKPAWMRNR